MFPLLLNNTGSPLIETVSGKIQSMESSHTVISQITPEVPFKGRIQGNIPPKENPGPTLTSALSHFRYDN